MNSSAVVNVMAAMVVAVACLVTDPAAAQALNMNRYGKQQLAQKQNRYGNTAWPSSNRISAAGWPSSALYGNTMMRHYPVSTGGRYLQTTIGDDGGGDRQGDDYGYDAADLQSGGPYDSRSYDRLQDYAVVRYPSYGGVSAGGYYSPSVADLQYDARGDDDDDLRLTYEDAVFGGRDPVAAAYSSGPYYSAAAAFNRYRPSAVTAPLQSNVMVRPYDSMLTPRYHPPTDKIHKFRKVFMSNLVSPSNAFKSPKEQQLYEFWESLINGDLDSDSDSQQQYSRDRQSYAADDSNSVTSQLYQHLPPIFQQLQQQQKLKQQQQRSSADHDRKSSSYSAYSSPSSSPSSASTSASSSSSSTSSLQTVPRGNLYKQWANGSPLIKRSSMSSAGVRPPRPAASATTSSEAAAVESDNDDVRQLEKLKTDNTTSTSTPTTTASDVDTTTAVTDDDTNTAVTTAAATPLMADGGQREYVLPRPAGEKSGFESLLEVIAEGGLHGNIDKDTAAAYRKLHQEAKMHKKRSYVSDETSLAAQLGALRKN